MNFYEFIRQRFAVFVPNYQILRIMKVTFFLIVVLCLKISAAGFAQKITFYQKC